MNLLYKFAAMHILMALLVLAWTLIASFEAKEKIVWLRTGIGVAIISLIHAIIALLVNK